MTPHWVYSRRFLEDGLDGTLSQPLGHEKPAKASAECTKKANREKQYLCSDLVSALTGLQMHNFAHFGQMDTRTPEQQRFTHEDGSGSGECPGFVAPPLKPSTGLNRWCNFTSSPWQPKTGGEREEPEPVEMADRMRGAASAMKTIVIIHTD